jgi:acyl transferase domain-containing protein
MLNECMNGIAVIGMSCRFPKANDVEEYWENIKNGRECMEELSEDELEHAGISREIYHQENYIKRTPSIADIDKFDADFFKISPKEAAYMDPQQRLILEKAWEAMEDAGYDMNSVNRKVAVFASTSASSYFLENLISNPEFVEEAGGMKAVLHGLDKDHVATKIAYKLNFTGPAVTVQSACSSSMAGTVMACQSLLTYQSDLALAGGVTVNVPQKAGYLYEKGSVVSKDGYCRPFDELASGTVFGSGVGCIVLKRLEDAVENHDRIYCVIRGFSLNNDGNDKIGYTAPSMKGQMDVILEALEFAQVNPATISYVETHGTATLMGDPIEVEALSNVYKQYTDSRQYCAIGSVKANIGHLNVASGIASIIKTAKAVEKRVIPSLVNITKENSKIDFKNSPFYINREWKAFDSNAPYRAAVSSFGIGGTNGHIILEEFLAEEPIAPEKSWYLIPLSARDREDLSQACLNLSNYLKQHPDLKLSDIERTLACGRTGFQFRKLFAVRNRKELLQKLEEFKTGGSDFFREDQTGAEIVFPCTNRYEPAVILRMYDEILPLKESMDEFRKLTDGHDSEELNGLIAEIAVIKTWRRLGINPKIKYNPQKNQAVYEVAAAVKPLMERYLGISLCSAGEVTETRQEDETLYDILINGISKSWEGGEMVIWDQWLDIKRQNIITLPAYPFKRNRYWSKERHERPMLNSSFAEAEDELQVQLIQMWSELLGIEKIGIEDDFFEMGGHSLMATQLLSAIKDRFLVDLEIDELFGCPTVSKLADKVAEKLNDLIEQMDEQEMEACLEMEDRYGSED